MPQVDTDELLNSAIAARAELEPRLQSNAARRAQIAREMAAAGGRGNRGRMASLQAELTNLHEEDRQIHQQQQAIVHDAETRANASFRNAHIATQASELQQHANVADAVTKVQNGVSALEAKYPNRTFDSAQAAGFMDEMNKLTSENPLYSANRSAAARVSKANEFHQQALGKEITKAAVTLAGMGINPLDFINRDRSNDYATKAENLPKPTGDATKDKTAEEDFQKQRSDTGGFVHFQAGGQRALVKAEDFRKWNGLLAPQTIGTVAPVQQPQTEEQRIQGEGFRNTDQYAEFRKTGNVVPPAGVVNLQGQGSPAQADVQRAYDTGAASIVKQPPTAPTLEAIQANTVTPQEPAPAVAAQPAAQTPAPTQPTVDTSNLPKIGDTRVVGGVTHVWNGNRWDLQ